MNKKSIVMCVRDTLNNCLDSLNSKRWLCCNSLTDFTRNRKISFVDTLKLMLQLESKSLPNEVLDFFDHKADTPTVSALIQQRNKINEVTYIALFNKFTQSCLKNLGESHGTFNGYHLIAVDGSDMNIRRNPSDDETFIAEGKGFNAIHLNAMYDLLKHVYLDATIQGKNKVHERAAFNTMVDRYSASSPAIFIADRGYESYNTMAHVIEKGQKFLIRVKDASSNGILNAYCFEPGPYDVDITTTLTKRRTKETTGVNAGKYTILVPRTSFDFLSLDKDTCEISFRAVRFKVKCDTYVTVVTNLSREEFPADDIQRLYRLRWGIMPISA